jgi:hypothetical protein
VDLYRHLAKPLHVGSAALSLERQPSSVALEAGPETITKVVETGDEGRCGLLLGQIAP